MLFRLGEATHNGSGDPTSFYLVTDSFLFAPGMNVRVVNNQSWAVQHGNGFQPIIPPRVVVTKGDAQVILLPPAAFEAQYTITYPQDTAPPEPPQDTGTPAP